MKILIKLIFLLLLTSNCFSQENKVKLAVGVSNSFMKCFTTGRFFDLTTAELGVDIKNNDVNVQLYGVYGYNTNLIIRSDIKYGKRNFSLKSNLLGFSIKMLFPTKSKVFSPVVSLCFLSEFKSNYFNNFIDPLSYTPKKTHTRYKQQNTWYNNANFYQSTPLIFNINFGYSYRIVNNLKLNLSLGYNLNVMNYKFVEWSDNDVVEVMIKHTTIQRKALHSIAGQIGLNYVFSFKKESKIDMP